MTEVTELEEIVVSGQRRKGPSDPFPRMMWVSVPPPPWAARREAHAVGDGGASVLGPGATEAVES